MSHRTQDHLFPINARYLSILKMVFVALPVDLVTPLEEQMSRFEKQREPSRSLKTLDRGLRVPA